MVNPLNPRMDFETWTFTAGPRLGPLGQQLMALRPQLAQAAQKVIDEWQSNPEFDDDFGGGGICDEVAREMSMVLSSIDAETTEGGQEGDDHAWLVVYNGQEAYDVDIPSGVYETGGGYSWQKIQGARVEPEDVVIQQCSAPTSSDKREMGEKP